MADLAQQGFSPSAGVVMATRCYNGQPLLLQQGPSLSTVASSHCSCIGIHGHGMQGLDYHPIEIHPRSDVTLPQKAVGLPEASPGQEWHVRRQQKRRNLRRICLFVCLFVLNIVVSVGVSVLILSFVSPPASKATENQRTICIPCSPEDSKARKLVGTSKDASKGYVCCASGEEDAQMKELILEGVKESLQERLKGEGMYNLLNNLRLPPPINLNAAHVFLKFARRQHINHKRRTTIAEEMNEEYELLRDWSSEGNAAFIRQGIEFNTSSGHFKVKESGIYVIYSRVVFGDTDVEDSEEWSTEGRKMVFGHAISSWSYSHNGYRELLEDEQLSDCVPGSVVCYNSRIFSTLRLTKDMTIAVRVRKSNFVSQRSSTSYFGLYKID